MPALNVGGNRLDTYVLGEAWRRLTANVLMQRRGNSSEEMKRAREDMGNAARRVGSEVDKLRLMIVEDEPCTAEGVT